MYVADTMTRMIFQRFYEVLEVEEDSKLLFVLAFTKSELGVGWGWVDSKDRRRWWWKWGSGYRYI